MPDGVDHQRRWRIYARSSVVFGVLAYLPWLAWFLLFGALAIFIGLPFGLGLGAVVMSASAFSHGRRVGAPKRAAAFGMAAGLSAMVLTALVWVHRGFVGFGDDEVNGAITTTLVLALPAALWVVFGLRYGPRHRRLD